MTDDTEQNTSSPSTTTEWEWRKIMRRPTGPYEQPRNGTFQALSRRDQREPMNMLITYRGGPQCWWQIEARGRVYRVPGYEALHDVMSQISSGELKGVPYTKAKQKRGRR